MPEDVLNMETIQEHAAEIIDRGLKGRTVRVLRQDGDTPLMEEAVQFDPSPQLLAYKPAVGVMSGSDEYFVAGLLALAEAVMPGCVAFVAMRDELESAAEDAPDDAQELAGEAHTVVDRVGERVWVALLDDDGEHLGAWIQNQCEKHLGSFSAPAEEAAEDAKTG